MKWGDIEHEHERHLAKVFTTITSHPHLANDIYEGMIRYERDESFPRLVTKDGVKHVFPNWWDVELLGIPTPITRSYINAHV